MLSAHRRYDKLFGVLYFSRFRISLFILSGRAKAQIQGFRGSMSKTDTVRCIHSLLKHEEEEDSLEALRDSTTTYDLQRLSKSVNSDLQAPYNHYYLVKYVPERPVIELWLSQVLAAQLLSHKNLFEALLYFQFLVKPKEMKAIFKAIRCFRHNLIYNSPQIQLIVFNRLEERHLSHILTSIDISKENHVAFVAIAFTALIRWDGASPEVIGVWLKHLCRVLGVNHIHELPSPFLEYCFKIICGRSPHLIGSLFQSWFSKPSLSIWEQILSTYFKALKYLDRDSHAKKVSLELNALIQGSLFELENCYAKADYKKICDLILKYHLSSYSFLKTSLWIARIISIDKYPTSYFLNRAICALSMCENGIQAYLAFEQVIEKFPNVDPRCHVSAINALTESKHPPEVVQHVVEKVFKKFLSMRELLLQNNRRYGILDDPFEYNVYVSLYNALLKYSLSTRQPILTREILECFQLYHSPPIPWNPITFHMLIREASRSHKMQEAEALLTRMVLLKYRPTSQIYFFLISAYFEIHEHKKAWLHFNDMINLHNLEPTSSTLTLIQTIKRSG
ncbi:hypothetical protein DSO57_1016247 [Entomophthora muscae]|uniref:Uncharacterized protein n=1 Tax=Entomophthora muscae TaxID=34485 RepID=A0ACC2S724_9FUNG|nr:hypothetical protein DSO57_1016247 [Entomophthora muscae]